MTPLNPRQAKFVDGYLAGKPAKQAYLDAGYEATSASADAAAARLLANVRVQQLIAEHRERATAATGVTLERVVREYARVAFADVRRLFAPDGTLKPVHEWDDDTAAAVAAVETEEEVGPAGGGRGRKPGPALTRTRKVKLWDKVRGLAGLLGHLEPAPGTAANPVHVKAEHDHRATLPAAAVVAAVLRDLGLPVPGDVPPDGPR
jgi:phage terminase small subunit